MRMAPVSRNRVRLAPFSGARIPWFGPTGADLPRFAPFPSVKIESRRGYERTNNPRMKPRTCLENGGPGGPS